MSNQDIQTKFSSEISQLVGSIAEESKDSQKRYHSLIDAIRLIIRTVGNVSNDEIHASFHAVWKAYHSHSGLYISPGIHELLQSCPCGPCNCQDYPNVSNAINKPRPDEFQNIVSINLPNATIKMNK